MSQAREAGFTLIEALVAMAVLALGAVSLLTAAEGHTARISDITDRGVARWAAQYALAEAELGLEPAQGTTEFYGQQIVVTSQVTPTTDPALQRITLSAGQRDSGQTAYRLDGYVAVEEQP